MAIEIVDFPIKNGDFPWQNVSSPEGRFPTQHLIKPKKTWQHAGSTAHQREGTDVTLRVPCQDATRGMWGEWETVLYAWFPLQKNIWLVVWNMFYFPYFIHVMSSETH